MEKQKAKSSQEQLPATERAGRWGGGLPLEPQDGGTLRAQALEDSAMLWPPAAAAPPSAAAAGTRGLLSDPVSFPISI